MKMKIMEMEFMEMEVEIVEMAIDGGHGQS